MSSTPGSQDPTPVSVVSRLEGPGLTRSLSPPGRSGSSPTRLPRLRRKWDGDTLWSRRCLSPKSRRGPGGPLWTRRTPVSLPSVLPPRSHPTDRTSTPVPGDLPTGHLPEPPLTPVTLVLSSIFNGFRVRREGQQPFGRQGWGWTGPTGELSKRVSSVLCRLLRSKGLSTQHHLTLLLPDETLHTCRTQCPERHLPTQHLLTKGVGNLLSRLPLPSVGTGGRNRGRSD